MASVPDPVIIIDCANNCGSLPGWDWLWFLLITLGSLTFAVILFVVLAAFLDWREWR